MSRLFLTFETGNVRGGPPSHSPCQWDRLAQGQRRLPVILTTAGDRQVRHRRFSNLESIATTDIDLIPRSTVNHSSQDSIHQ